MHIFLDTNIILPDPFFNSFLANLLLEKAAEGQIKVYLPEVVLKEVQHKSKVRIFQLKSEIETALFEFYRLTGSSNKQHQFKLESPEDTISAFYSQKINEGILKVVDCTYSDYQNVLESSVKHDPPFFQDKKKEFKDALIWEGIKRFLKENGDSDEKKYFISNNYRDFWNSDNSDLHVRLKVQAKSLTIFPDYKKLFDYENDLQNYKALKEFKLWLTTQDISVSTIQRAVEKYLWNHIADTLKEKLLNQNISWLYPNLDLGFIVPTLQKENFKVLDIISVTAKGSYADIETEAHLSFLGEIHLPNYERGDFSNISFDQLEAKVRLSLSYNKDELYRPIRVEIDSIKLKKTG